LGINGIDSELAAPDPSDVDQGDAPSAQASNGSPSAMAPAEPGNDGAEG
jgi:hypothetical protein